MKTLSTFKSRGLNKSACIAFTFENKVSNPRITTFTSSITSKMSNRFSRRGLLVFSSSSNPSIIKPTRASTKYIYKPMSISTSSSTLLARIPSNIPFCRTLTFTIISRIFIFHPSTGNLPFRVCRPQSLRRLIINASSTTKYLFSTKTCRILKKSQFSDELGDGTTLLNMSTT